MSLIVWLPLNGDLENQGLSNMTFSYIQNNGALSLNNSGKIGKCYERTASAKNDLIRSSTTINLSGNISMACWAYVTGTIGDTANGLVTNHSHVDSTGVGITVKQISTSDYRISCNTGTGSSRTSCTYYGTTNIKNAWHHLALTYNKTTKQLQLWVDSKVEYTLNNYTNASKSDYIDIFNWSTTYYTSGDFRPTCKLNDVRIYDHCLSAKEVKDLAKGLVLHYRLAGPGGENLLIGNYSNHKTSTTNNSTGGLTLDTNLMPYSSMVGKTFTFSFDYSCEGTRANSGSGMDNRYGLHLGLNYTPNGGSAIQDYPCASYLYMSGTGKAVQTFRVPSNCTVNNFFVVIQPTTKPSSNNNATWYIKNVKLEEGSVATPWCPNPADSLYSTLGYNNNIEYDCSGYRRNGTKSGAIAWDVNSPRYTTSYKINGTYVDTTSNTLTGAAYITGPCEMPATSAITFAWWGKIDKYGRGGVFETTSSTSNYVNGNDYDTTAIANWNSTFGVFNGSTRINLYSHIVKANSIWQHNAITFDGSNVKCYINGELVQTSALTGKLPAFNGIKIGIGRAGGVYRQIKQNISDFRIYATALSAEDIAELYHSAVIVDNTGKNYAYEYFEG